MNSLLWLMVLACDWLVLLLWVCEGTEDFSLGPPLPGSITSRQNSARDQACNTRPLGDILVSNESNSPALYWLRACPTDSSFTVDLCLVTRLDTDEQPSKKRNISIVKVHMIRDWENSDNKPSNRVGKSNGALPEPCWINSNEPWLSQSMEPSEPDTQCSKDLSIALQRWWWGVGAQRTEQMWYSRPEEQAVQCESSWRSLVNPREI